MYVHVHTMKKETRNKQSSGCVCGLEVKSLKL
jgi:hypothetical protein